MTAPVRSTDENIFDEMPGIIEAAYAAHHEQVARLLAEGVDVNTVDPRDNLTILHIACMQGDDRLVDIILEHDKLHGGVDFDIRSRHRPRLAWQFAINCNFPELAERVDDAGLAKARHRSLSL